MNEATRLLGVTCDTFIKTLEECMTLSNANNTYQPLGKNENSLPLPNPILSHKR